MYVLLSLQEEHSIIAEEEGIVQVPLEENYKYFDLLSYSAFSLPRSLTALLCVLTFNSLAPSRFSRVYANVSE